MRDDEGVLFVIALLAVLALGVVLLVRA